MRYIYYWNVQYLHVNNVIINKTKALLPQAQVTLVDFGSHVVIYLHPGLFGFPIYSLWTHLINAIRVVRT